jgi:2-keto-4-pentenoate hydratase
MIETDGFMNLEKKRAACAFLYGHWQNGTCCDGLPPGLMPADRADAYGVQACIEDYSAGAPVGWKIAATSKAGQAHIGVEGPMAGRLLAERAIPDGGSLVLGNNLMKVAEMEFAFRFGEDLPPRAQAYTQAEVLARVSALHPAIELPDSRYQHFERVGDLQLIADNACAHYFVLGPAATEDWRDLDLAAYKVRGLKNGALTENGLGANVLGDPRIALTWLVNELSQFGAPLRKDQVVITGTCVKPVPIAVGDRVEGDFGQLGTVAVKIA